jgi:Ser/Thr protein kinase RdoA (MazF antagonist)
LVSVTALANLLEATYGLSSARCQLIQTTIRDTYRVSSDQGTFLLCIYTHNCRPVAEINAELDFMDLLHSEGVNVGPAISAQGSNRLMTIQSPEGERQAVLFTYVEGCLFKEATTLESSYRYGQAIAQLHTVADTMSRSLARPHINWPHLVEQPIAAFASAAMHRPEDVDYLRRVATILQPKLEALSREKPHYGLVHGDVIPSNALIGPSGDVTLLDFDFCGFGWRAYDVATFISETKYWKMQEEVSRAFLEGYQKIRSLAADEFASVPLLEAARNIFALGIPAMKVNEWGRRYFHDRIIDRLLDNIKANMEQIS